MDKNSDVSAITIMHKSLIMVLVSAFVAGMLLTLPVGATTEKVPLGKALVFARNKGNCLACHAIAEGKLPGDIGPPLNNMKERFPEREALFNQIWNASKNHPDTRMPPFGRHAILSREEIDLIVEYLYTL